MRERQSHSPLCLLAGQLADEDVTIPRCAPRCDRLAAPRPWPRAGRRHGSLAWERRNWLPIFSLARRRSLPGRRLEQGGDGAHVPPPRNCSPAPSLSSRSFKAVKASIDACRGKAKLCLGVQLPHAVGVSSRRGRATRTTCARSPASSGVGGAPRGRRGAMLRSIYSRGVDNVTGRPILDPGVGRAPCRQVETAWREGDVDPPCPTSYLRCPSCTYRDRRSSPRRPRRKVHHRPPPP